MGNGNSQIKEVIDLSPRTLALTSVDDKVWLGIPEENLFNDSFTIEKYYMLQSKPNLASNFKDIDHYNSIEQIEETSFFSSYKDRSNLPLQQQLQEQLLQQQQQQQKNQQQQQSNQLNNNNNNSAQSNVTNSGSSNNNSSSSSSSSSTSKTSTTTSSSSTTSSNNNTSNTSNNSNSNSNNDNNSTNSNSNNNNSTNVTPIIPLSLSATPSPTNYSPSTNRLSTTINNSNNSLNNNSNSNNNNNNQSISEFIEEYKNRSSIPVYLIPEDPYKTHQKTLSFILEDLYSQSNVNTAYYITLLQKRLCILKRIHLALKREIARKKLFDSIYHSKAKTRTKKVHMPPISIRIACRLFLSTLQEQVFEQKISLSTLKSFNVMIKELPPLSMAGEPQDCIDSLNKWLLSALSSSSPLVKRESMEALIGLSLSQGSLSSILSSLSLIITPDKNNSIINNNSSNKVKINKPNSINNSNSNSNNNLLQQQQQAIGLRMSIPIKQLEQWKVDLPLSPLSRDLLFATWPIQWNDNIYDDSLAFLSSPNYNIATITSDSEYIYIHDTCGLAKIGTGYFGTHQGRVYARNADFYPKEKGWLVNIANHLYYRSPSTDNSTLIVLNPINLEEIGRINQDGLGSIQTVNNLSLPFGPECHDYIITTTTTTTTNTSSSSSLRLNSNNQQQIFSNTNRSPIFTDGRYLYLLSLQRFHNFSNKQFIVDMYDPFESFQHYKRIELRYPDGEVINHYQNEELVLNPNVLELGSFYTNGHYLMVVLPPPLGSDYNYDSKSFICRAFSLSDGTLIGNYCLENQPIGLASFYDYLNNVIWNYSSSESEIGKYGNEGFGPKHNFPSVIQKSSNNNNNNSGNNTPNINITNISLNNQQSNSNSTQQQQTINVPLGGNLTPQPIVLPTSTIVTAISEEDNDPSMEPKEVVSTILSILSRLAIDYMPSVSDNTGSSNSSTSSIHHVHKLTEPYSVEVCFSTFSQLYDILEHYRFNQLKPGSFSATSLKTIETLRCIIYCLRLLKVNLFRLTSNIRILERNQQIYQDSSRDGLLKCIDQNFLHKLRTLLLNFVIDGIDSFNESKIASSNSSKEKERDSIAEFETIREESCEVLTIGLDLFYPTSLDKANFIFYLLDQFSKNRLPKDNNTNNTNINSNSKDNFLTNTLPATIANLKPVNLKKNNNSSTSITNNNGQIKSDKDQGYSMLLNRVLILLSSHPNASFFALPPLSSEFSSFSLFNINNFTNNNNSNNNNNNSNNNNNIDSMNLFVPIITHLLQEAQATIPPQNIIPQISRQDSTNQHLGSFSLYSSAPPPPLSSPAMRLLLAIQKDLILRVENSVSNENDNAPSQALVAYSKLLMDKCRELLIGVLDLDSQKNQSILLTDFKSSVVGALLPTLIHSLFLFSYRNSLAKELLPPLVQLIGVVDRVNRRLPKLLNRPELGRQPLQKRSSFVEGPSRISESPHPYHAYSNTRQSVTIPGAVFLSLVFDDRSYTSSLDDVLQIYESQDSKEPLEQFSHNKWPKRRILIPGDTVVFQFITGPVNPSNTYSNFWGYRCNIIGHMPNSDKTSLPWSSHLEKTMCCLAGRFSSCLISGDALTGLELENSQFLESPLFSGGVEEDFVSSVLFSNNNETYDLPYLNQDINNNSSNSTSPIISTAASTSTNSTINDDQIQINSWKSIQRFCYSLAKRNDSEIYSNHLSDFMWKYITGEKLKGKATIKSAQQSVIAALIKHLGLGDLALNFSLEIIQFKQQQHQQQIQTIKPPQQLIDVWKSVLPIRMTIIQRHQESQLSNHQIDDITESQKRRSVDMKTHSEFRESIYKEIADKIIENSMFLLELQSYYDPSITLSSNQHNHYYYNNHHLSSAQLKQEISSILFKFVLSNTLQINDIKKILISRRSRAYSRSIGLQAMRDILKCASDHSMKPEALCFIGPALRNSGLVKRRCPPYHYLDFLHGSGTKLIRDVKKNFKLLMEDVSALLNDPNSDSILKLYALDAFTLNFSPDDSEMLTQVDIFNKIHNLMTNESIWGGIWNSSNDHRNSIGSSPSGSILHSNSTSSFSYENDINGYPPYSTHSSSIYSNCFIEEEKLEREKLKKNAKALFKFLGLICVDITQSNSDNNMNNSSVNNSGINKFESLRDSFFTLMATQLESSLVFLKETNKTYWGRNSTSDNSNNTPGVSSPNTNLKSRRIYRVEKSYVDLSDSLSLLYILSAFDNVKQRLCSSTFLNIFHCILQVGDETQRKLILRIFRRILPSASPYKLFIPISNSNGISDLLMNNSSGSNNQSNQQNKTLFSLLLEILGAVSYWGCSSDIQEISKYIDPRYFISSNNFNLYRSSSYNSTKIDSPHSFFSIFDKTTQFPSSWDIISPSPYIKFSDDSKIATFVQSNNISNNNNNNNNNTNRPRNISNNSSSPTSNVINNSNNNISSNNSSNRTTNNSSTTTSSSSTVINSSNTTSNGGNTSSNNSNFSILSNNLEIIQGLQLVKSDIMIPESTPFFYFEVKIEIETKDIIVGLFPSNSIDQLKSLKDWRFGLGYSSKNGHKVCYRVTSTQSRVYSNGFGRNDVIGCGYNHKDGKVFFTKNGKYLGTAFKNVMGDFYPVVALSSGGSVSVNFGQQPFQYDLTSIIAYHLEFLSERSTPSMTLSYVNEIVPLLRILMKSPLWKQPLQKYIIDGLKLLPSTIQSNIIPISILNDNQNNSGSNNSSSSISGSAGGANNSNDPQQQSQNQNSFIQIPRFLSNKTNIQSLFHVFSTVSLLSGYLDGIWPGARVEVDIGSGCFENGTVVEYSTQNHLCRVLLDCNVDKLIKTTHNRLALKPIQEIQVDFSIFSNPTLILQSISTFLKPPLPSKDLNSNNNVSSSSSSSSANTSSNNLSSSLIASEINSSLVSNSNSVNSQLTRSTFIINSSNNQVSIISSNNNNTSNANLTNNLLNEIIYSSTNLSNSSSNISNALPPTSSTTKTTNVTFNLPKSNNSANNNNNNNNNINSANNNNNSNNSESQLSLSNMSISNAVNNIRNIYLYIKSRVMKIFSSLLKYSECSKYTLDESLIPILVEFALGRPIQFMEEPKIEKMERLSYLLKEKIYDKTLKSFLNNSLGHQYNSIGRGFGRVRNKTVSSNQQQDETVEELTSEFDFEEDNEISEIPDDFDDALDTYHEDDSNNNLTTNNENEDSSSHSSGYRNASGNRSNQNIQQEQQQQQEEDYDEEEIDEDESLQGAIADDDLPEEGIAGKRILWNDIKIGMHVLISKRERLLLRNSNWVHEMDDIIGHVGIVKSIDKKYRQVLVSFLDDETLTTVDWWMCYETFTYPNEKSTKNPIISIDKYSHSQLIHLDTSCEMALSILYSRQALISLLVTLPNTSRISYQSFGGAKNLIYILKLTLYTTLLNDSSNYILSNNSMTKLLNISPKNYKDYINLKSLQSKLSLLLKQESNNLILNNSNNNNLLHNHNHNNNHNINDNDINTPNNSTFSTSNNSSNSNNNNNNNLSNNNLFNLLNNQNNHHDIISTSSAISTSNNNLKSLISIGGNKDNSSNSGTPNNLFEIEHRKYKENIQEVSNVNSSSGINIGNGNSGNVPSSSSGKRLSPSPNSKTATLSSTPTKSPTINNSPTKDNTSNNLTPTNKWKSYKPDSAHHYNHHHFSPTSSNNVTNIIIGGNTSNMLQNNKNNSNNDHSSINQHLNKVLENSNSNSLPTNTNYLINQSLIFGEPLKTGNLMKQQKIIKLWKRIYVVLSSDSIIFYKPQQQGGSLGHKEHQYQQQQQHQQNHNTINGLQFSNNNHQPIGSIDLRDIVSVTQVSLVKQNKISFSVASGKKDFCFQITLTSNKTHLFQASSQEDLNDWIQIINSACISSASFRSKPNFQSTIPLIEVLTKEVCVQLKESSNETLSIHNEESPHPYPANYCIKKIIRIEGAQSLLITFDTKSYTEPGLAVLRFFYDPSCTNHISSYSGKFTSLPPTIINSCQFWMVFTADTMKSEWGYKFNVIPIRNKTSDVSLLPQPSFEFACFLVDWVLLLDIQLFKNYPNFFSSDLIDMLLLHLNANQPLDRKLKAINFLTRLLQKLRENPIQLLTITTQKEISSKIEFIKDEMFKLYKIECGINNNSNSSNNSLNQPILSQYLQKLIEICIQTHVILSQANTFQLQFLQQQQQQQLSQQDNIEFNNNNEYNNNNNNNNNNSNELLSSSNGSSNNGSSNLYLNINNTSININNNYNYSVFNIRDEYKQWFSKMIKTSKVLEHLFRGKGFGKEFIKESFIETRSKQVIDSPHPYPPGARVTSNIIIPDSVSLKIEFDAKSRTQTYVDYLMFSKSTPGGDDLGFFTGEFPTQPIYIQGDRFIWSFYSDSNDPEWGFRFTITPQFSEEVIRENDQKYEKEILVLSKNPWNHSMDLELVKFVNAICEKQKKNPYQLIFEQCLIPEYLTLFPSLSEIEDHHILYLRFVVLKHFNSLIQSFINFIDLRGASDDWSISYKLCSLRGLLFNDCKLEILNNSLIQTKSFGRRPIIHLNRHGALLITTLPNQIQNNINNNQIRNHPTVTTTTTTTTPPNNTNRTSLRITSNNQSSSSSTNTTSNSNNQRNSGNRNQRILNTNINTTSTSNNNNTTATTTVSTSSNTNQSQQQQQQNNNNNNTTSSLIIITNKNYLYNYKNENLFLQSFRQLCYMDPLRLKHNDRAWEVKLEREGARDAGGPYRECMTQIVTDLQSREMNLFLPCQNAQGDVAFNRDKLVPNSSANSPLALQLYEYIGRLIGIAIRTKNCVELSFPSIIWKSFVCAKVERIDLEAIDKYTTNFLELLEGTSTTSEIKLTPDIFLDCVDQTFTTRSIDNSEVELIPDGRSIQVTWENRVEYSSLLEQYKLSEFRLQIDAMVKGASSIIPLQILNLFTWQEIEQRVCGIPGLDIKLLKKHTRYCGLLPSEARVAWFWRIIESFSSEEQTLFLRFVWGRSRLPSPSEFNVQFQIYPFIKNQSRIYDDDFEDQRINEDHDQIQDEYLPEAQTCFFTLSIPNYSSLDVMREKLLYAITSCREIDADYIVAPENNIY